MKPLVDPSAYREQISPICKKLDILSDMIDTNYRAPRKDDKKINNKIEKINNKICYFFMHSFYKVRPTSGSSTVYCESNYTPVIFSHVKTKTSMFLMGFYVVLKPKTVDKHKSKGKTKCK